MRNLGAVLAAVILLGCGGIRSNAGLDGGKPGGGVGGSGGSGGDGGSGGTGGTGGTGGSGGTGGTGGATGGGTGGTGGGGPKGYSYSAMSITSSSPDNSFYVRGISGRAGETYAISDNGRVLRATTAGFAQVAQPATQGNAIWVAPNGAVFVSFVRQIGHCEANCTVQSNFVLTQIGSSEDMKAVCGLSHDDVYMVGQRDNERIGVLYHWNGTTWTKVSNNLGLNYPTSCAWGPNNTLLITGYEVVVQWANGGASNATAGVDLSMISNQSFHSWNGLWVGANGNAFVVGDKNTILRRDGSGWSLQMPPPAMNAGGFRAIAGPSENELYAAGYNGSGQKNLFTWNGTVWKQATLDLPVIKTVYSTYLESSGVLYWGGGDSSGSAVILRGTR